MNLYYLKYIKYKLKYLKLKELYGGEKRPYEEYKESEKRQKISFLDQLFGELINYNFGQINKEEFIKELELLKSDLSKKVNLKDLEYVINLIAKKYENTNIKIDFYKDDIGNRLTFVFNNVVLRTGKIKYNDKINPELYLYKNLIDKPNENLENVLDIIELNNLFFVITEKNTQIETKNLEESFITDKKYNLPDEDKKHLINDISNALKYLENINLYHGDISLDNIVFKLSNGKKQFKLIDYNNLNKSEHVFLESTKFIEDDYYK